jgi:alkane 1-monooxygenase
MAAVRQNNKAPIFSIQASMHFLLSSVFPLLPLIAWHLDALWLPLLSGVLLIPVLEWLLRKRTTLTGSKWGTWYPRAMMAAIIAQGLGFAMLADRLSWPWLICFALSCGYMAGAGGIVLAHELAHRRPFADRMLARLLLSMVGYGHYAIEHNRGHHRAAATFPDPATARLHENLWQFLPRYFFGVGSDAIKLSRARPGWLNEALALAALTIALFGIAFVLAGWQGLVFCLLQAATAQFLVGAVDYVEHWGLLRKTQDGKTERLDARHIWDCSNVLTEAMLFNLPRHAAHHLEPSLNSDELYRNPASPQMPTGYAGMVLLACVPPLFRKIMTPRLPAG